MHGSITSLLGLTRIWQHGFARASVANDIALFRELDLDMIGIGPFIPHPATPLGSGFKNFPSVTGEQVPNNELMVYKAVALTRLVRPDVDIPATTALATINKKNGREWGLQRGAYVFMPNLALLKYRLLVMIEQGMHCRNWRCVQRLFGRANQNDWPAHRQRVLAGGLTTKWLRLLKPERSVAMPEIPAASITICMGSSCFSRGNSRNIEGGRGFFEDAKPAAVSGVERTFVRGPLQIGAERHDQRQDVSRG